MCSGRVEVYRNSIWGTVCDNSWDINAANVVCRVLNCGTALSAERGASYGNGTGDIWWYNVSCDGKETNLDQCSDNPQVGTACTHTQDAGVSCSGPMPVRLVNGSNTCSGRVEIYSNSAWGTICDSGWDVNAARVVCRVLNCGTALSATRDAYFGEGTGDIWMDNVKCDGTEIALDQCSANPLVRNDCSHREDAGVICSGPVPIRLVNGTNMCSGRVEVYRNSIWGTICDDGWDVKAANVVCKVLNCGTALSATRDAYYEEGNGVIWPHNVSCDGTEYALDQCSAKPWVENNCTHSWDAGVICSGPVPVRLVNGSNMCSGRVELYRNSVWGTVCDNGWDVKAANVVCSVLNCGTALSADRGTTYGVGTGVIWSYNVFTNLDMSHACLQSELEDNVTFNDRFNLAELLMGRRLRTSLSLIFLNLSQTIEEKTHIDHLHCRELSTKATNTASMPSRTPSVLIDYKGTQLMGGSKIAYEDSTSEMEAEKAEPEPNVIVEKDPPAVILWRSSRKRRSPTRYIPLSQAKSRAYIKGDGTKSGPVPVRLVNGSNMCSGRVEVYRNSIWGSVCDNGWDVNAANVVCSILNCGTALSADRAAFYGEGTEAIWPYDVSCDGTESTLDQCTAKLWVGNNCSHRKEAGVTCSGPVPVKLVNGSNMCSGRVEVYRNSIWGTVCDNSWDINAANVVCRVLNCGTALSAERGASYGNGTGDIWWYNVSCDGKETNLDQCSDNPQVGTACTHTQDAGVSCSGPMPVRLVNGSNTCSGRVEIYSNSAWGTICDSGWDVNAARVVCRVLNCGTALSATRDAYFGEGTGDIWMDNVKCDGTEIALDQCSANPLVRNDCSHREDAGVICSGPVPIRLVNGTNMCSGRVEVYRNSIWGTICDDGWDVKAANVVCKVLNCGTALSATRDAYYEEGNGVIWPHNVSCDGTEYALDQCSAKPWVENNCTHSWDAGVICSVQASGLLQSRLLDC
ncbi:scavenger receptor cysteine-rich domain-containing protein DMBT1-like [Mustelus asterias]